MKLVGGMKFREIAETLHQPIGTVTWIYNQAIKKLRRCLAEYEKS
jgi:RNA polymerase sigma-70 factor (ECF subfamily)